MQNIDKETNEFLLRMGPTFHMTLFHHHQITAKINEIEEPNDDELITFELAEGEYSIFYKKLKGKPKVYSQNLWDNLGEMEIIINNESFI